MDTLNRIAIDIKAGTEKDQITEKQVRILKRCIFSRVLKVEVVGMTFRSSGSVTLKALSPMERSGEGGVR